MKSRAPVVLLVLAALAAGISEAGVKNELRFPAGGTSASAEGAVIRGDRDVYYVTAKAGQTMEVDISAAEDNAAFSIYLPGSTVAEKDGAIEVTGKTLPKAGDMDDATTWKGTLPASGKYLFMVGGTRGDAEYKLRVTIR